MPYPIATSWKVLRVIVGLSQAELSKRTGIKQARLSAIELGRVDTTEHEELELSKALAWKSRKAAPARGEHVHSAVAQSTAEVPA